MYVYINECIKNDENVLGMEKRGKRDREGRKIVSGKKIKLN